MTFHVFPQALAERAAWDYWNDLPAGNRYEFCTVLPAFVLGPALTQTLSSSQEVCLRSLFAWTNMMYEEAGDPGSMPNGTVRAVPFEILREEWK